MAEIPCSEPDVGSDQELTLPHLLSGCSKDPGRYVCGRGEVAGSRACGAVCCPELGDDEESESLPEAYQVC